MRCPTCNVETVDVTESWNTFTDAEGAEYLASYVTIWHCSACGTIAGTHDDRVEWILASEVTGTKE